MSIVRFNDYDSYETDRYTTQYQYSLDRILLLAYGAEYDRYVSAKFTEKFIFTRYCGTHAHPRLTL